MFYEEFANREVQGPAVYMNTCQIFCSADQHRASISPPLGGSISQNKKRQPGARVSKKKVLCSTFVPGAAESYFKHNFAGIHFNHAQIL